MWWAQHLTHFKQVTCMLSANIFFHLPCYLHNTHCATSHNTGAICWGTIVVSITFSTDLMRPCCFSCWKCVFVWKYFGFSETFLLLIKGYISTFIPSKKALHDGLPHRFWKYFWTHTLLRSNMLKEHGFSVVCCYEFYQDYFDQIKNSIFMAYWQ